MLCQVAEQSEAAHDCHDDNLGAQDSAVLPGAADILLGVLAHEYDAAHPSVGLAARQPLAEIPSYWH